MKNYQVTIVDVSEGTAGLDYDSFCLAQTFYDALVTTATRTGGSVASNRVVVGCGRELAKAKLEAFDARRDSMA